MGSAAVGSLKDLLVMAALGTHLVLSKREGPHNPEASEERGHPGKSGQGGTAAGRLRKEPEAEAITRPPEQ